MLVKTLLPWPLAVPDARSMVTAAVPFMMMRLALAGEKVCNMAPPSSVSLPKSKTNCSKRVAVLPTIVSSWLVAV